jgi:hypothetical protein
VPDLARPRFWAERPATFSPAMPETPLDGRHGTPDLVPPGDEALVLGVRLARGVTLMLDGRTPGLDDLAAIRRAAAPLLAVLHERHLMTGPTAPAGAAGPAGSAEPAEPEDTAGTAGAVAGNPEGMQR